jgi:hypothetical protein
LVVFCSVEFTDRAKSSCGLVEFIREFGRGGSGRCDGATGNGLSGRLACPDSVAVCGRGAGGGGRCCFARSISIFFSKAAL